MKRAGNLFGTICSWDNLELAARRARRRKRYRLYAERFELRRESILRAVRDELVAGAWTPKPYRTFTIHDPKERTICAPCYRDRIVHHALHNVVAPIFERSMVDRSFSCRVGMGTKAARAECRRLTARHSHVLKMDVRKYFPSIDHAILKSKIRRHIKCRPTLEVLDGIVDSWRDTEYPPMWFPGDDLLAPATRSRGLPIGALTSQLFANLFLNRIDHWILESVRPAGYIRYTDDLLLFSNDKTFLHETRDRLIEQMAAERLMPHPTKRRVHACREGIPFLGFRFWPDRVRVMQEGRIRFERRIRRMAAAWRRGTGTLGEIGASMYAWFQFVREFPSTEGLVRAESGRIRVSAAGG
ncbi:MAG: RNA-dependent DNA polymerase [Planctomycetes bacterium]|nr:RNA-dependent DNA polymerase [Planctomycetota bacterium]